MSIFDKTTFAQKRATLTCSEDDAWDNLERAALRLVRDARWAAYHSKIDELRKPLLQLRMARRRAGI